MEKKFISSRHLYAPLRQVFVLLLILVASLHSVTAVAQGTTVHGTVNDANGKPLGSVTVSIKGSTVGTHTNTGGQFSLMVPGPKSVLVFSSVGFTTKEITVGSQTEFTVALSPANISMDEVIVI